MDFSLKEDSKCVLLLLSGRQRLDNGLVVCDNYEEVRSVPAFLVRHTVLLEVGDQVHLFVRNADKNDYLPITNVDGKPVFNRPVLVHSAIA